MGASGAHILIIEDDADLLGVYRELCRKWGYRCDTATEGFEGLELFRAGAYDLVLLDLELPDVKGDHLARELLKRKPALPVIVVTGFGTADRARRLGVEGVFQFIHKPFDVDEMHAAIQSALRRWALLQTGVSADELFELREIALMMREGSSRHDVLRNLLRSAVRLTHASSGSIMLWDPKSRCLVVEVAQNLPPEAQGSRVPIGGRVAGKVFQDGRPRLIAGSVESDRELAGAGGRPEVKSSLCVPAYARGVPAGVLNLNSTVAEDFFEERDLRIAAIFADDAAAFLAQFDLTDQLRAKVQALEEAQASLQQISHKLAMHEKMSSVGTLAGGIAHQFNNLLAIIQSNLEMITLEMIDPQTAIRKALEATRRAAEVAAGMLAFSRNMRRTDRVELSVRDVIQRILLVTGREFEAAHVRLLADLDPDEPLAVTAAPAEIQEILMSLLNNAREAIGQNGEIRIRGRRDAEQVVLEVRDTGPGIPADQVNSLFDPFYTTKPEGTGLGLWRVFTLTRGLGGTVQVRSAPGEGACFCLRLPGARAAGKERADAGATPARR
jgi:signal transduction histidine kinase/DNA-binding response OmpR family regulator